MESSEGQMPRKNILHKIATLLPEHLKQNTDKNKAVHHTVLNRRDFLKLAAAATMSTALAATHIETAIGQSGQQRNNQTEERKSSAEMPESLQLIKQSVEQIVKATKEKYQYANFFYPVSDIIGLPETFPRQQAEIPLVSVDMNDISKDGDTPIAGIMKDELTQLFTAAQAAGLQPFLRSGFRSVATQEALFNSTVETVKQNEGLSVEEAKHKVRRFRAEPRHSEHHLGLAVDIMDKSLAGYEPGDNTGWDIARQNYNNGLFQWLREHSHEFGFVLSYPTGRSIEESKAGCGFTSAEPWHLRFVDKPLAQYAFENNYLEQGNPISLNLLLLLAANNQS